MRPLIGINADYRAATKTSPAFSFLAAGYYDAVARAGGIPVIIPPIDELLGNLAGVVLVGGLDLDPRLDGYMLHPAVKPMAARREEFDRLLCSAICTRRLPVMAIGTGMQLLNVMAGGTLHLHLPEDFPDAIPHLVPGDREHRHAIDIEPHSLLKRVYGSAVAYVTSCHHQAVDDVAPGFRVTARCPDGVIEAIESVMDDWPAFGVQFHPEAEAATAIDGGLFECFIETASMAGLGGRGEARQGKVFSWTTNSQRRNA